MLNVWVGNLGKYNEGELVGAWLELPKTNAEIDKFLKEEVGINKEYEEYMINDYETDLPFAVNEYESLRNLNALAKLAQNVENMEAIEAYVEAESEVNIEELVNIILQKDDIPYYEYEVQEGQYNTLSNKEKYGMMKAEWSGISEFLEKNDLTSYFDYESFGEADELSGYVDLYDSGYLDRSAMNEIKLNKYLIEEARELADIEDEKIDTIIEDLEERSIIVEETEEDDMEF